VPGVPGSQRDVDREAAGFAEAVQAQVTGVSEAWDESESEELNSANTSSVAPWVSVVCSAIGGAIESSCEERGTRGVTAPLIRRLGRRP
jgi:hypothetical protein